MILEKLASRSHFRLIIRGGAFVGERGERAVQKGEGRRRNTLRMFEVVIGNHYSIFTKIT